MVPVLAVSGCSDGHAHTQLKLEAWRQLFPKQFLDGRRQKSELQRRQLCTGDLGVGGQPILDSSTHYQVWHPPTGCDWWSVCAVRTRSSSPAGHASAAAAAAAAVTES